MSNSGPTSETTGNIAIASASDSTARLPRHSSRPIAYAASVASTTERKVAVNAIPAELSNARVKSGLSRMSWEFWVVQAFGKNWALPAVVSAADLNDSETIQTTGSRHQTMISAKPTQVPATFLRITP